MTTPPDIKLFVHQLRDAIAAAGDGSVTITMDKAMADLFVDFLINTDPDMARAWRQLMPQPLCKLLGPIVGDQMMNTKLQRLDELIQDMGTAATLMTGLAVQLEKMVERRAG